MAQSLPPTDEFFVAERWRLQLKYSFSTLSKYMKKCFWFFLCLFSVGILFAGQSQAILAPQIYLTDIVLDGNTYKAGATITGSVKVRNYEESHMGNLFLQFELLSKEIDGVPTQVIDRKTGPGEFGLAPGEAAVKSFNYVLPANLPGGNAIFRVQLVNGRGEEINWDDAPIIIGGEGIFLELSNARIMKGGEALSAGAGVYYNVGEVANIKFNIKNDTNSVAIVFPRAITYKRNPGSDVAGTFDFDGITVNSKSEKTAEYELPKLTEPETYFSEIRLYDSKTKLPVSNSIYFRWIISGVNAKILHVDIDKSDYQAGETAQVNVSYAGPADHEFAGDAGTITAILIDGGGNVAGQASRDIALESGNVLIDVPVQKDVRGVKIETEIADGAKILDGYEFKLESGPIVEPLSPVDDQKENGISQDLIAGILIAVGILAAIGIGIKFFRRKKISA